MNEDQEKDKLVQELESGKTAYSLREKLLAEQAFIEMKAGLISKFEQTEYRDDSDRTEIWRKMQVIAWFDDILTQIMNNGKIAQEELKGFAKFKQVFTR